VFTLTSFDIFAPRLPVVFCGINPSPAAAATGHNFGSASNRFWRVLHLAGYTPVQLKAVEDRRVLDYGCGITAAVSRATRRASELGRRELAASNGPLLEKLAHYRPDTVAFLGKAAYSALRGSGELAWGPQPERLGGASVWLLPNTSGPQPELHTGPAGRRICRAPPRQSGRLGALECGAFRRLGPVQRLPRHPPR
jgi:TDG/mug DNA glycosylase family protein